ncbi:hypothetical protein HN014_16605 [Aquimarina sp. TRL1]|uniref:type VI secretion system tube protein TssD n=1 Tax=Aquimarina sp. (strain TRL1) TaxID=2736252 RepID=UPI00158CAE70|nr:type VI secretion system tube protein TssD [Aquimarina sp. TRL1]QKX06465.1 hypothetical protein HN014_16605 [Aquimarina sp. TRL1]
MISYIVLSIETQIINSMGFKAELVLDNKIYPLLLCDYEFSQTADHTGRPNPYITAGIIDIRVPMTRDDVLVDWVLQPSLMKKGTITIYKYDLSAVETTINFYNAHGLHYHLAFDAESAQTAYIDFRISAGELHLNELIHENRWNPERHQAVVTPREEETVLNPRIVSGWWSYDREGKDRYLQEKDGKKIALELGQSMYFHVETAEIPAGGELQLQLFDYDHFLWVDNLNYDTSKFPNDPVYKNAIVEAVEGKSIATVQVDLDDSWEPVITDDHDEPSIDQKIELYWDISYTKNDGASISATMPRNQRDFLKVGYNTRDLYIQPSLIDANIPEFRRGDNGNHLLILNFGIDYVKGKVTDKVSETIGEVVNAKVDNITHNFAIGELKKGKLVDNFGKVYQNPKSKTYISDTYTNEGDLIKDVERRKDFTYRSPEGVRTTKGINQYDYFSKNGATHIKVLGFLKNALNGVDTITQALDVMKAGVSEASPFDEPLNLDFLIGLTKNHPLVIKFTFALKIAGVLIQGVKSEWDEELENSLQHDLDIAKAKGLQAVKNWVFSYGKKTGYKISKITTEAANKMLQGELTKMEEVLNYRNKSEYPEYISILYKEFYDSNSDKTITILESFYLNN